MTKQELQESLASSDALGAHAVAIAESASECIVVRSVPVKTESEVPIGASKIGGNPDLPLNLNWPFGHDVPLTFIAQIALHDMPRLDASSPLPSSGWLSFFYDADEQPWGYDPKHAGSWKVIYMPRAEALQRREFPDDYSLENELTPCSLSMTKGLSLASLDRANSLGLDLDEEQMDSYEEVAAQLRPDGHQLLGLPAVVQGDDMELECQLASSGLYCGDATGYDDPRAQSLSPNASDWRLLMQFDSDENSGMIWGDAGYLYFWIREQDLSSKNFDNVWVILQCY